MLAYQFGTLTAIALSEGRSNAHDMSDDKIVAHVISIAQSAPYNERGLSVETITVQQRQCIVSAFHDGAYDR